METLDVGDAELAYRREGSGPPVVFVHGWPLSSATWRHLVPLLAPHHECIVFDQAGAGATRTRPNTDYNFRGQARRLNALIEGLGLDRCHVVAQDTGATIARYAALTSTRLASLVLMNTEIPGHRPPFVELFQASMRLPGALTVFRRLVASRTFRRSSMGFGGCFVDLDRLDGDFHELVVRPMIERPAVLEGLRAYLLGIDWGIVDGLGKDHARIEIPTLFTWGEDDVTFPIARARPMLSQLPRAELAAVPRAALLVHEEQPAAVADLALAFWRKLGA